MSTKPLSCALWKTRATITYCCARAVSAKIEYFLDIVGQQPVYLLIDEYDHFANALLADDLNHFRRIIGKGGFVRAFYETLKTATQRGILARLFITGITPVMLDNLTSGFNIVKNLSHDAAFNEAIGFNRHETESLIQPLAEQCRLDTDKMVQDVTNWYNGYRFSENTFAENVSDQMYNAEMVLYFIDQFDHQHCQYPRRMLDENIASDYGKILALFSIGDRDVNYEVLDELINEGEIIARQRRKFDFDKGFDRNDFISLLYYMGFISFNGFELTHEKFRIPNYVIKILYFEYFKVEIERKNAISIPTRTIEQAIVALALQNDIEPLRAEVEQVLTVLSNRDFIKMDEKHLKMLLVTLLYQSDAYFIKSEPEINQHYPDIMLLERSPIEVNFQHLIELKYCKKADRKKSPQIWQDRLNEGTTQVQRYLQLRDVQSLSKLSAWVVLTDGEEVMVRAVTTS